MISFTRAPSNLMREDRVARIIASQNLFFDLVEREAEAPQNAFKHGPSRPHRYDFFEMVELTIGDLGGLTLDFEAKRPADHPIPEVQCTVSVGVFRNERYKLATELEENVFVPIITDQGSVLWQHRDGGTGHTPQQLCGLAFQRLRDHAN